MWDNEAAFSKYLYPRLNTEGLYVHRLESHGTGNGLPDMFVMGNGKDFFLELKNNKKLTVAKAMSEGMKVDWRPGQQPWAYVYKQRHASVTGGKLTATVVGLKDGIIIIPMVKVFENNIVMSAYMYEVKPKSSIFEMLCTLCYYTR